MDCANDTSETFFFWSSAYNPVSFKNICGRATWTPVGETLASAVPILTPVTVFVAANVTDLRSAEIALTRLNLGDASVVKLIIMISFTFKDPNVLPAHVNTLDALMLTSSPIPNSFITFDCNTKSPEKSAPDMNVSSWWTDFMSSRPNFWTVVTDLVNESSPFILIFSPTINVPDTWSKLIDADPPPCCVANPVAPLLNPSTKLVTGSSALDNATFTVKPVYNWTSYK